MHAGIEWAHIIAQQNGTGYILLHGLDGRKARITTDRLDLLSWTSLCMAVYIVPRDFNAKLQNAISTTEPQPPDDLHELS
jgi:hypothetical protein